MDSILVRSNFWARDIKDQKGIGYRLELLLKIHATAKLLNTWLSR